jgi:lipopolysaccharide transport system ATP-binding protein
MSDRVIEVRDVSKQYRLGMVGTGTLSHDLNRWWAKVRGQEDPYSRVGQVNRRDQKAESDYVWALKDINFDVHRGEILGIIGANGAGKSTLLKLMSRITSPTTGYIRSKGRIASLLEVGTGMHPEMTARENIYLNGSIMGMRRHEITRKFDDIIDFAGCAMYVDTPVKRFSSGMKVRLGFAVAAFLEPEILIVDEVLAVGDAEFQQKCLGKMQDITKGGDRTVLFVSHNMAAIENLCDSVATLHLGRIAGLSKDVTVGIDNYLALIDRATVTAGVAHLDGPIRIVELLSEYEEPISMIRMGDGLVVRLHFDFPDAPATPTFALSIENSRGVRVYSIQSAVQYGNIATCDSEGVARCELPDLRLTCGTYYLSVACETADIPSKTWERVVTFEVTPSDIFGTGKTLSSIKCDAYTVAHWRFDPHSDSSPRLTT